MGELGKLIDAASRANHGRSMQAASDLATSRGVAISKSTISNAATEVKSATPLLIRGIAAGYDVPEEDVARAVLADLGFAIGDYKLSPESAIRRDPDLSAEARAILLAAIDAARQPSPRGILSRNNPEELPHWGSGIGPAVSGDDAGVRRDQQSG